MRICGCSNIITQRVLFILIAFAVSALSSQSTVRAVSTQDAAGNLTPRQREINKQQERLSSAEVEERRDALMKLGTIHHVDASRVAVPLLKDASPIVRATAATAILSLPSEESVAALIPLLSDKEEFVRQEAAYALGRTGSRTAVSSLGDRLMSDKKDGVRTAAAVALGQIGDATAAPYLIPVISGQPSKTEGKSKNKPQREKNEFVLRAAVVSLGQLRSRDAVPALLNLLADEKLASDVKRESAVALGLIGDPSAVPALEAAAAHADPYLARAATEAVKKISRSQ